MLLFNRFCLVPLLQFPKAFFVVRIFSCRWKIKSSLLKYAFLGLTTQELANRFEENSEQRKYGVVSYLNVAHAHSARETSTLRVYMTADPCLAKESNLYPHSDQFQTGDYLSYINGLQEAALQIANQQE